jgi:hypothetical protein
VRYVLLLLHACRNLVAIKSLSHSPPFDQRNWFGVIGGSLIALVALRLRTYKTPQQQAKPQSVMTPIRRTDQHERLGDYNISCGASKELDDDQCYFYQQGFFSRLARAPRDNQVILIEPAGELGKPGRTTFVIRTTLRTCLTIRHLTNVIIIHGVTEERSLSIPGPSHIQ